MRVVILVPWRGGNPWRERVWRYVATRWLDMGWPVAIGGMNQVGLFNRAAAKNEAARSAGDWDVGVFVDADCVVEGRSQIEPAVELAAKTGRLVLPFEYYSPLLKKETSDLLDRGLAEMPIRHPEPNPSVGGVVVVHRSLWDRIGGYDTEFVGWGFEDSVFYMQAGKGLRTPGELWHLWHPVEPETVPHHPVHVQNRDRATSLGYEV